MPSGRWHNPPVPLILSGSVNSSTMTRSLLLLSSLCLAAGLAVLAGTAAAAGIEGSRFSLEATRSGRAFGPFTAREGATLQLEGRVYTVHTRPPDRVSFTEHRSGRLYGPAQLVEGRMIDMGGVMYAFTHVVPADEARPDLPPPPRPPPLPEPIPIPPETLPPPPPLLVPRPLAPPLDPRIQASVWIDLLDQTPLEWEAGGQRANDASLERVSLGGGLAWQGWFAELGLSGGVTSGDILPSGVSVSEARLEDGAGVRVAGGYWRPVLAEGGWQVLAGAHVVYRSDAVDLKSTTAVVGSISNGVQELSFASHTESITVSEFSTWLDAGIAYNHLNGGGFVTLSVLPFYILEVDGDLTVSGEDFELEASREQPLTVGAGGWYGRDNWQLFTDVAAGSDRRWRLGASWRF